MADKNISMLPKIESLDDDSLLVVEQGGKAGKMTGAQFREFAEAAVDPHVDAATNAAERAEAARDSIVLYSEEVARQVSSARQSAQEALDHKNAAAESAFGAEASKNAAESAKSAAASSEENAKSYSEAATSAERVATTSATNAASSETNARGSAESAAAYAASALAAKEGIEAAQANAQESANAAAASASDASTSEIAAKAAQKAAEEARDAASEIAGGDFASKEEAKGYANTAESNAKNYTDQKIAAIPAPDVSGQINAHNADGSAHSDIRVELAKKYSPTNKPTVADVTGLIDWFGVGESIPENADLDTYTTNGKFYCSSDSRAKTLVNCPVGTNFCMWVFSRNSSSSPSQMLVSNPGKIYTRSRASAGWKSWVGYTTPDDVATLISAITAADVGALALTDIRRALAQVDTSGNVDSTAVTSYPTEPGVYKVTTALAELPSGSARYGTLMIFNGGAYVVHLYVDNNKRFYVARTTGGTSYTVNAPTSETWYQLYSTGNKPTAADVGARPDTWTPSASDVGAAPSSHNHSASDISSGTLAVARGGTGVTSIDALATALGCAKIVTGSYKGTGAYGSSNPNSLTFDFAPKLIGILGYINSTGQWVGRNVEVHTTAKLTTSFVSTMGLDGNFGAKSSDGKTIYWYSAASAQGQCNDPVYTYHYYAIG